MDGGYGISFFLIQSLIYWILLYSRQDKRMTFIPEDEREAESTASEEKTSTQPAPEEKKKKEEKKGGNPINSIIFLVVIGVALYYSRDFLSGEKEIPGLSQVTKASSGEDAAPIGELKIPRVSDKELKALLEEFKTEYEARHDSLLLIQTQPEVTRIRYTEDKQGLLIVLKSLLPSSGQPQTQEIIYGMDDFRRLVTTGPFSEIKLYPED